MTEALFTRVGEAYLPSDLAGSPWSPDHLHGGPPTGLMAHALERCVDAPHMRLSRLSVDLLRPVPKAELRISVETVRSGRRLQVLAATMRAGDVTVCRATALFLEQREVTVPEHARFPADALPVPENGPVGSLAFVAGWLDQDSLQGLHTTAEAIRIDGIEGRGRGRAWMRLPVPLVADVANTPTTCVATLADFGNGVGQLRVNPRTGSINADVNLHLHRLPQGEWIGFDAVSRMEEDGVGLAETVLHDRRGPIGRVLQSLMVMPVYAG